MQRLNRDLARQLEAAYGDRAMILHPHAASCIAYVSFVARSIVAALRYGSSMHVHGSDLALLPLLRLLQVLTGARTTVTACGLDVVWERRGYQWMVRRFLLRMQTVVCISAATAEAARERGAHAVTVISCGLSQASGVVRTVSDSNTSPVLLTVGRLVRRKGVAWFIEHVFPLLQQEHPGIRYIILGSGPEEPAIRRAIAKGGFADCMELHTCAEDSERDAFLLHADLFVMPNIPVAGDSEGFGIVCIEAAARGLPVAASRIEGVADAVIAGQTGRFFAPKDATDAARVISDLLRHPMQPADVAISTERHFSWSVLFPRYRAEVFGF